MKHKPTTYELALWAALPMAHTSNIEKRLTMVLDGTRNRRTITRRVLIVSLGLGSAVFVPLAMLKPMAKAQAAPLPAKKLMSQATARVSAVHAVPGERDAMALEAQGRALTPDAAAVLEGKIAANPNDYTTRIQLLGYYGGRKFTSFSSRAAYQQQVFWLIRTHPESVLNGTPAALILRRSDSAAFEQGKSLWLKEVALHPGNTVILGKAAFYCELSDKETAENLLHQAKRLEPKNPNWPNKLGSLYQLQATFAFPESRRTWAEKALAEYESAAQMSPDKSSRNSTSADLAKAAFDAGEYEKARHYATALMLRGDQRADSASTDFFHNHDDDLHQAHLILGRLALRDGNTSEAESHLRTMGHVSGSPTLDSFGPNMQLAKELLEKGDRQPVLAYFQECAKFWKMDNHKLAVWKAQVEKGEVPNFGANLVY